MSDSKLDPQIFNTEKRDYTNPDLFLGETGGLIDSINKSYPNIWATYKGLKSDDWDENEFDFTSCINDFKTCDRSTYDMMIKTLAWQWEADSVVANSIAPMASMFVSSDELWCAWVRVTDNELVHALTYSEIVRNSFENPEEILDDILEVGEAIERLEGLDSILSGIKKRGHELSLGYRVEFEEDGETPHKVVTVIDDQETYNYAFKFPVALLFLERLQFIASFAVTFAIADTGLFQPIGKAVQRIAKDEIESHAELDKEVIRKEMATERGKIAYEETKGELEDALNRIVQQECLWVDFLFSEGRELVGLTPAILKQWIGFNAKFVFDFMGYEPTEKTVSLVNSGEYSELRTLTSKNPLPFMTNWLDMSKNQAAPQEEDHAQYKMNAVDRNDEDADFDIDF